MNKKYAITYNGAGNRYIPLLAQNKVFSIK